MNKTVILIILLVLIFGGLFFKGAKDVYAQCDPGYTEKPSIAGTMCCQPVGVSGFCTRGSLTGGECCYTLAAVPPGPGGGPAPGGGVSIQNPLGTATFDEMLDRILSWLWPLSGAIAVLMILIGAYYMVLSGGNPEKIATGRRVIIFALVGFAIVTMAKGIVEIVEMILGI